LHLDGFLTRERIRKDAMTLSITAFSIMTLSIMTHSIMTLNIMTHSIMTLGNMTHSIMTLSKIVPRAVMLIVAFFQLLSSVSLC
jgi:hypothetical protein